MTEAFKVCVIGDTHNNFNWLANAVIPYAAEQGCRKLIQVGDFGFLMGEPDEYRLDALNRRLEERQMDLHFLPGNHEDHDLLATYTQAEGPEGHFPIRPRLYYAGRVSKWEWAGRKIGAVGGAVSIDRDWRQSHERVTGQKVWWPEEVLSPEEAEQAQMLGRLDILFTHDAPVEFPLPGLKVDLESQINRQLMSSIGRATCPKMWTHGHYHASVTYPFRHENGTCEVRGLDCDGSSVTEGVAILDLSSKEDA